MGHTQPLIQRVRGIKRPGREFGHSPQYTTAIQNEWSYNYNPSYAFMG